MGLLVLLGLLAVGVLLGLPEAGLQPERALEPCSWVHPLGFDALGRDGLVRLGLACLRSLGWASGTTLLGVLAGGMLALGRGRWAAARDALRSAPPLLGVLLLVSLLPPLGWGALALMVAALTGLHLEPVLRVTWHRFLHGPAPAAWRVLGASDLHRLRVWAPWMLQETRPLMPLVWVGTLMLEVVLRVLGLGPGPHEDSLGLVLAQELPTFISEPTALGLAALGVVLSLAAWLCALPEDSR